MLRILIDFISGEEHRVYGARHYALLLTACPSVWVYSSSYPSVLGNLLRKSGWPRRMILELSVAVSFLTAFQFHRSFFCRVQLGRLVFVTGVLTRSVATEPAYVT